MMPKIMAMMTMTKMVVMAKTIRITVIKTRVPYLAPLDTASLLILRFNLSRSSGLKL